MKRQLSAYEEKSIAAAQAAIKALEKAVEAIKDGNLDAALYDITRTAMRATSEAEVSLYEHRNGGPIGPLSRSV